MKLGKNYYGCADQILDNDYRQETWEQERKERGFDDTETWSLDITVVKFIRPRLERFIEVARFKFDKEELAELNEIVQGFKTIEELNGALGDFDPATTLSLFAKYFRKLWW